MGLSMRRRSSGEGRGVVRRDTKFSETRLATRAGWWWGLFREGLCSRLWLRSQFLTKINNICLHLGSYFIPQIGPDAILFRIILRSRPLLHTNPLKGTSSRPCTIGSSSGLLWLLPSSTAVIASVHPTPPPPSPSPSSSTTTSSPPTPVVILVDEIIKSHVKTGCHHLNSLNNAM